MAHHNTVNNNHNHSNNHNQNNQNHRNHNHRNNRNSNEVGPQHSKQSKKEYAQQNYYLEVAKRQKGNPLLKEISNVQWRFKDAVCYLIFAGFQVQADFCKVLHLLR